MATGNLSGWVFSAFHGEGFPSRISWESVSCLKSECGDLGGAYPDVWQHSFPTEFFS